MARQLVLQPDPCPWCGGPVIATRRDARTCSKPCRQALQRFEKAGREVSRAASRDTSPRRLAYADPPYPGLAHRYYGAEPDYAGEVNHLELLELLAGFDGWALSTNSRSLARLLELAATVEPREVLVAAWLKGHQPHPSPRRPLQAWEPVLYVPARELGRPVPDAIAATARARLAEPRRVTGTKPAGFAFWLLELLAAGPRDSFADLYPGSGGITRAWELYRTRSASQDEVLRRLEAV